ncbi:MAG: tRNA (N(6)-L-threonylcarbamoyladenosine(37)-C(2))-methylthiotransferase MtaB [Elusimicrobiota bacterium]|jgi:threonylcarbamoyladenosine tRNA methylthiotransferase MtaB|nr:tRNA (N(6)-L-threonylcarbamoyladenosine(37)-C(2))-methylthiotransferase MtaB [Elusimicrobiota bacterium]
MKVYIKTFGCRVNQVESQAALEEFKKQNYTPTQNAQEADLCLINTCSVTHKADRDAGKEIRKILRQNPKARLIITGCYAAVAQAELAAKYPSAKIIQKTDLSMALFDKNINWAVAEHEGKSRAFVKIQDGCDNYCAYCIVPYARGKKTSKPAPFALAEITNLITSGYKEIVLTGINIGNYSCPLTGANLAALLPEIFKIKGDFRIRFSSIEVNTVTPELVLAAAAGGEKFCNYFHIPLQSGAAPVLKSMKRRYTPQEYLDKLAFIRQNLPGAGIYADIIAGYPAETQADFEASVNFTDKAAFAGLHVFSYSARKGTPAAQMPQLSAAEIKTRADILRQKDKELRAAFAKSLIGATQQFLAEEETKEGLSGVLGNFQRAIIKPAGKAKTISQVKITAAKAGLCCGEYSEI